MFPKLERNIILITHAPLIGEKIILYTDSIFHDETRSVPVDVHCLHKGWMRTALNLE